METTIIISLIVIAAVLIVGVIIILNKLQALQKPSDDKSMLLLQNQVQDLSKGLDQKFGLNSKMQQDQFIEMSKLSRDTVEKLAKLDETNKQVLNFSDQLKNLQDILKNPKQRGVLGEYFLEETLKNVLPPGSYQMQYAFSDGEIVDAVVFVKDKIIPIDSKFSLENYERILNENDPIEREKLEKLFKQDLKNRIDETAKYVRPGERTMDFAFMFIPSEAIYYDLLVNKVGAVKISTRDLITYAFREKHVIIVSPTSFLAYLQTVLQGLRALQIEESAKEIKKNVEALQKHLINYDAFYKKLGAQLGTVVNTYTTTQAEFKKIDKDVMRITGVESELEETPMLEKPRVDE
ncbi:MAG: DNA recombination protein RmuC [Candidatus Komeilibacteria bacterium]